MFLHSRLVTSDTDAPVSSSISNINLNWNHQWLTGTIRHLIKCVLFVFLILLIVLFLHYQVSLLTSTTFIEPSFSPFPANWCQMTFLLAIVTCIFFLTSTGSVGVFHHSGDTSYYEEHSLRSAFEVARTFCHPALDGCLRRSPPSMLQVAYSDPGGLNSFEQFLPPELNRKLWNTLDLPLAEGVVVSFYSWSHKQCDHEAFRPERLHSYNVP